MDPIVIGIAVFVCTFGSALVGMRLRTMLPAHHLESESRDTVKVGVGLVATMTALVLGLVTASAKNSFDAVDAAVKQTAIEILTLDRVLLRYGPEASAIREALKQTIGNRIEVVWPPGSTKPATLDLIGSGAASGAEALAAAISRLTPGDDSQRALQSRALDLSEELLQVRWLLLAGTGASVPMPFLLTLLLWLTITFASFGLFAPRNATVLAVLLVCALSVGSAIFLVLEMDTPFEGLLRVSSEPLRAAHANLAQ